MRSYAKELRTIELEKERQKELVTLKEGFQVANTFVNKGYLDEFALAEILRGDISQIDDIQKVRFFKMSKVVFDPKEDVRDKLTSVYSALYNLTATVAVFIKGTKNGVEFYFACRSENVAPLAGDILESTLVSNFPGIDIRKYATGEIKQLFERLCREEDGERELLKGLATISMVPDVRDSEKKDQFVQGMEKVIGTLSGKEYICIFLATPMNSESIANRRHGLEELYSTMTPHAKLSYAYGENESQTISKGITSTFSKSVNKSISNTNSTSSSSTHSKSHSTSSGFNNSSTDKSTGSSWGMSSSTSDSVSDSYTSGTSFSHSISDSVGNSESNGTSTNESSTTGNSTTKTLNYENKGISELLKKIEQQLKRLNDQESYGMWESAAYFFSNEVSTSVLAAATYKAVMAGETSGIEQAHVNIWIDSNLQKDNIRNIYNNVSHLIHPKSEIVMNDEYNRQYVTPTTLVSSTELGLLMGFPRKSLPGVAVQEMAEFGRAVVYENKLPTKSFSIGNIYHMGVVEDTRVDMDLDLLSSHCFITGSSGSGKSYATYNLLDRLLMNGIKMLVIEPAKGEYKQIFGNLEHVNIYTTDQNTYRLLRINPFFFPEKIHILSHIEQLQQIFSAAWPLYAAMPAILKKSIVNAYILCGWDIQNSIWIEGISDHKYPTFDDVMKTLPDIINSSEYSAENKGNYKGALLTRVEAMTTGLNGLIFKKSKGISDKKLFDENTIIDLSEVGSDETIALIMGVIIMRLNEYRKSQRKMGLVSGHDSGLNHVTVLEEAHNLLKRVSKEQGVDGGNMTGKSVEMISNSIKEMRTYGEGFLIIDQSPLAVDSSAIENTATKIIMNTPTKDACVELGSALSLTDEQTRELSKLNVGVAAVLQKGWMTPVLMKIGTWDSKKYEASLQSESINKVNKVRSELVEELCNQVKIGKYKISTFGSIIRKSELDKDRSSELYDVIDCFKDIFTISSRPTSQQIGDFFIELISCRSMIDAIPYDGILSIRELNEKLRKVTVFDEREKLRQEYFDNGNKYINKLSKALNYYIRVSDETKFVIIKYMLASLGKDGQEMDTHYGMISKLINKGKLKIS